MVTVASGIVTLSTSTQAGERAAEATANDVGPGLIAFTIVVLLAIATFFLVRSMLHHIGKVPPTFDDPADVPSGDKGDEASGRDVG